MRRFLILAALCLALGAVERFIHHSRGQATPLGEAQWIWPEDLAQSEDAAAFYLVRDFVVAESWAEGPEGSAQLRVAVDPEYVAYLNGVRVGEGGLGSGFRTRLTEMGAQVPEQATSLDVYEVGSLLEPVGNRLVLEVRTPVGDGGALVQLVVGAESLLVSDSSFRVAWEHEPGLLEGYTALLDLGAVRSWGPQGTGRWPRFEPGEPAIVDVGALATARPPEVWATVFEPIDFHLQPVAAPGPRLEPEPSVLIDFGERVTGQLELWLQSDPQRGKDVFFADWPERLKIFAGNAEHQRTSDTKVVRMRKRAYWRDTEARSFRAVLIRGVDRVEAARVIASD